MRNSILTTVFVFLLQLGAMQTGKSQVINIEDKRIKTDTVGWSGSGEASLYMNKNNDFVLSVLTDLHIQYKNKKSLFLILTNLASVSANGDQQFVNSGFQHFRYNYKITDRFVWEAFVQGQYNAPLAISHRYLVGTGPRYKLIGKDKVRLYAATLYMFENEENTGLDEQQYNNRMSSYISITLNPASNFSLVNTTYYQPKLDDFSDRRISTSLSMKSYITKKWYLKVKYSLLDDSAPAPGITETVYDLTAGVGLDF